MASRLGRNGCLGRLGRPPFGTHTTIEDVHSGLIALQTTCLMLLAVRGAHTSCPAMVWAARQSATLVTPSTSDCDHGASSDLEDPWDIGSLICGLVARLHLCFAFAALLRSRGAASFARRFPWCSDVWKTFDSRCRLLLQGWQRTARLDRALGQLYVPRWSLSHQSKIFPVPFLSLSLSQFQQFQVVGPPDAPAALQPCPNSSSLITCAVSLSLSR